MPTTCISTAQKLMDFHLTCFILENLAEQNTVDWSVAFQAHRIVAAQLNTVTRELPWLALRSDPQGHKSFGVRMSRKIMCGDCKRMFGHKAWHSGTPNRADVWECPTNYTKRGTCQTRHLYQEVLIAKMTEAMQVLVEQNTQASELTVTALRKAGVRQRGTIIRRAIDKLLALPPEAAVLHIPDFVAILEEGCMFTNGKLGFAFNTGETVALDLPERWSPARRSGELAITNHRAS